MEKDRLNIIITSFDGKRSKFFSIKKSYLKFLFFFVLFFVSFSVGTYIKVYQYYKKIVRANKDQLILLYSLSHITNENIKLRKANSKIAQIEDTLFEIQKFLDSKGISLPSFIKRGTYEDLNHLDYVYSNARDIYEVLQKIPIGPPVFGRITSGYGYRFHPLLHRIEFHYGVDIKARYGTPVRATADGVVLFAGRWGTYGKVVIIRHSFGYRTLYAHLSRIVVRKGQRVKVGQVIGFVGNTGRSTGPHLHYEIVKGFRHVNPVYYMYMR